MITVDGVQRRYLVSADGVEAGTPAPVVVLLHGMGFTAEEFNRVTGLPAAASEEPMMVVTPQALGEPTLWGPAAQGPDAKLIDAILADLEATSCIDMARVHVAGFSVGAALGAAYACARQDRIASLVAVTVEAPAGCTAAMPILAVHGTADPVIAYGNNDPAAPGGITGTEANMTTWAATAGCEPTPTATEVGDGVTRLEWTGCSGGAEVVLVRIDGGGHVWPGGESDEAVPRADASSAAGFATTDEALEFFARHRLS